MVLEAYDWGAFGGGFALAIGLALLIRWRRARREGKTRHAPPVTPNTLPTLPPELRARILRLKAEGRVIDAVKIVRKNTGLSLLEAKQLVATIR